MESNKMGDNQIRYDDEKDELEIYFGNETRLPYCEHIGPFVIERQADTNRFCGIIIKDFEKTLRTLVYKLKMIGPIVLDGPEMFNS